jgi:hypothetical protein
MAGRTRKQHTPAIGNGETVAALLRAKGRSGLKRSFTPTRSYTSTPNAHQSPAVRALFRARDVARGRTRSKAVTKSISTNSNDATIAIKDVGDPKISKKVRAPRVAVPRRPTEGEALRMAAKSDILLLPTPTRRAVTRTYKDSEASTNDKFWASAPKGASFWGFAGEGRTIIASVPGALGAFRFIRRHESDMEEAGFGKKKTGKTNHLRFEFDGPKPKMPEEATFRDFLLVDIRLTRLAEGLYGEARRWFHAYNGSETKPNHSYHETLNAFGDRYFDRETRYSRPEDSLDAHVPSEPNTKPRRRRRQKRTGTHKEESAYNDALHSLFSDFAKL